MRTRSRQGERGAIDLGAVISLVVLVAAIMALWNVGPVYFQYFQFVDEVDKAASAYPRTEAGNEQCRQRIWSEAVKLRIDEYMDESAVEVSFSGMDRKVYFYYEVERKVIPGWTRVFKFEKEIFQVLI